MGDSGVYNSTTISYENPNGGVSMSSGGSQRRPWNLSEMVSPPINRSKWLQWTLLMGGSIILGLGLIVTVIGIYNQHYYDPDSLIVVMGEDESPPSYWMVTLMGFSLVILGLVLLVIYCKMVNTNRFLCNPLTRTRDALRQVVTKPRYQNGQTSQGANLLANDGGSVNPMSTQYDPIPDLAYHQPNGDISTEEKARLMAHEAKEGSVGSSAQGTVNARHVFGRRSPSPTPPQRPFRQFSSLRRNNPATSQFHYKPRHFTGHGYGQGRLPPGLAMQTGVAAPLAPMASFEDITPSLRSSFASVMMYPRDWGNSDDSMNSNVFLNLPPLNPEDSLDKFRVSPDAGDSSLSSISIHSAFS